jgi:hypothetical protein
VEALLPLMAEVIQVSLGAMLRAPTRLPASEKTLGGAFG